MSGERELDIVLITSLNCSAVEQGDWRFVTFGKIMFNLSSYSFKKPFKSVFCTVFGDTNSACKDAK